MLFSKLCCVQCYRWRLLFVKIVKGDTGFALTYAVIVNTVMMLTKENCLSTFNYDALLSMRLYHG